MKTIYRSIMTAATLAICVSVNATDFTLEKGRNELKPSDRIVNATYTSGVNGKVLIQATEVFDVTCNGKTYDLQYTPASSHGAYRYEVDVEKGQEVNVRTNFLWGIPTVIYVTEVAGGLGASGGQGTNDGQPTGISATETSVETTGNDIYDISGRKVSAMQQGLYIVNGKKYIKK